MDSNSLLFNRTVEQISENAERISIIYENCKFSKIGSKTFVRSQKFENLKELKFYNSEFNEIQRKAFDFYARDVMLEIEGSKEPFELNQDIFVDNQVTKFILRNVKLQELTKEALQGECKTQCPERSLNRIAKAISKTFTEIKCGFRTYFVRNSRFKGVDSTNLAA